MGGRSGSPARSAPLRGSGGKLGDRAVITLTTWRWAHASRSSCAVSESGTSCPRRRDYEPDHLGALDFTPFSRSSLQTSTCLRYFHITVANHRKKTRETPRNSSHAPLAHCSVKMGYLEGRLDVDVGNCRLAPFPP